MDQSLLLSDEVHLLKIRNFDKLQSKLKNISLTDKKNTAGADSTFLISAGNVVLTSVGVIFVNWCVLLKDLSKNESELITTIVQLGGGLLFVETVLESCKAFNPVHKLHQILKHVEIELPFLSVSYKLSVIITFLMH